MKKIFVILALILTSFTLKEEDKTDRIGIPGPIIFNNTNYNIAWTSKPRENYYVQEYLPDGEDVNSFKQMLTINVLKTNISVEDAVKMKVAELEEKKKTDKTCNYIVFDSPDGKEKIVDFLLSKEKDGVLTITEFNLYRYKSIDLVLGQKALLLFEYSGRAYGDDIMPFLENLSAIRQKLINKMINFTIPVIKLNC